MDIPPVGGGGIVLTERVLLCYDGFGTATMNYQYTLPPSIEPGILYGRDYYRLKWQGNYFC